jgi:hypothetical protein
MDRSKDWNGIEDEAIGKTALKALVLVMLALVVGLILAVAFVGGQ